VVVFAGTRAGGSLKVLRASERPCDGTGHIGTFRAPGRTGRRCVQTRKA
jgi:hypothetical protein